MKKIKLVLFLIFLINGFLNAQVIDSTKCKCDSILKSRIESRVMIAFVDRAVKTIVRPDNIACEIGKFSIDILVDRNGDVINADFNIEKSSNISFNLKTILINSALKSKFMNKGIAPSKQKGNIIYEFRLKDTN